MDMDFKFTKDQYRDAIESFQDLKVLVIGDLIFDRYTTVKVQGLTSKNQIISAKYYDQETHLGGAMAVYRHLKQFVCSVNIIGLIGKESWVDPLLAANIPKDDNNIIRDESFTTVLKERFLEPRFEGKELVKLFSVNHVSDDAPPDSVQNAINDAIGRLTASVDLVVIMDFGHGLFQERTRRLVEAQSPFLCLNCQTNSYNYGFNIISKRYKKADAFALDQKEITLAVGERNFDEVKELEALKKKLQSQYAWLTRGSIETIGLGGSSDISRCPPFAPEVTDTVGAGDAFFSLTSLCSVRGLPVELGTFIGQLAGAQAVKIVGNARPISKNTILEEGAQLLGG